MDKAKLRRVAEDLKALSESLMELCNTGGPEESPTKKPEINLEQIRGVLADKSRAGHTAKIREIIKRYGVDKLSAVDPKHYPEILKEAEELADE